MTLAVEMRSVGFSIGSARLLEDVSFEVAWGELVGVIGPNGAGKSTLLRVMSGELEPTSGEVALAGKAIADYSLPDLARTRCHLPQQQTLQFGFRCIDVVLMGRFPHEESTTDSEEWAHRVMAMTDTDHLADRKYPTLSGGEQARIAFARVVAQDTPIMLLDEPTATLDLRHQQQSMRVARQRAAAGSAVVSVMHDINLAAQFADRVVVLAAGAVEAMGRPDDVLTPGLLSDVYELDVAVIEHPDDGRPLVLPRDID